MQGQPEEQDSDIDLGIAKIELNELRKALAEEQEKAKTNLANWQRAQADFTNYRRRADQEKEDVAKFANTGLLMAILPFLDDLERALTHVPPGLSDISWVEGIKLMERKLLANLENHGVSVIKALGEPFDPRLHEAVKQDSGEDGIIIGEIQRGYKLRDRVLRPSIVIVGNGESEEE
ncbi:MAG TPA: nucleotide exchange factor GrpE [Dehalococcoidales bacterium]|nr:nucleotide exchange factor GrpE [Dehalococcoidales bacterium]